MGVYKVQIKKWVGRDENRKEVIEPTTARRTFSTLGEAVKKIKAIRHQLSINEADSLYVVSYCDTYLHVISKLFGERIYSVVYES